MTVSNISLSIEKQIGQIQKLHWEPKEKTTGTVFAVADGVATVSGLSQAAMGELVEFTSGAKGMILNLKDMVGVIVFGDYTQIKQGELVTATGKILSITGSYSYLGRVVDGLLDPIDGKGKISRDKNSKEMPVEKIAPGVIQRQDVRVPLQTGIKAIDALIPIGRGQRELIIGDRGIGKTAIAVDAIINQAKINAKLLEHKEKGTDKRVLSIYVAIGQKQSKIAQVMAKLEEADALSECVIIAAAASDSASTQYLAPFTATALAEYFMGQGEDVLIIYDDLSKHAWAYREVSLLLRRPSGREAYPGDIFYLHSKLLERAARMNEANGGGSITALPIIETQAGDISAYIPTNVISITDGQIYLEPDIFYSGIRPAVSVGLSVSRVGGDAQLKAMKQVAGTLKLDLAQYRELAAFAQFGSDLDESTQKRLNRGKKVTEVLKQNQYMPVSVEEQIVSIWLAVRGYLDTLEVEKVGETIEIFLSTLQRKGILTILSKEQKITDEIEKTLKEEAEKLS